MAPKKRTSMSAAHKAALAVGRNESRAVRAYLDALEAHRPKRGRKRTPESIQKRLKAIDTALDDADPLTKLNLVQERMNLNDELENLETAADLSDYEADFIDAAAGYSERKGISYAAWRELGVDAAVLKAAGIGRARN